MLRIKQLDNFGPIESIENSIELNDLTIFMGDNSAGKSYLAMLIAALFSMEKGYRDGDLIKALRGKFKDDVLFLEIEKACAKVISLGSNESVTLLLSDDEKKSLKEIATYALNYLVKKYLVEKIFGPNVGIGNLEIEIQKFNLRSLSRINVEVFKKDDLQTLSVIIDKFSARTSFHGKASNDFLATRFQEAIFTTLLQACIKTSTLLTSVYIPASRTGYLQTYKTLAEKAIDSVYYSNVDIDNEQKGKLNVFTTQFIQLLNSNGSINSNEIAEFIEEKILNGRVQVAKGSNDISFKMSSGENVNIHFLSSTASELIPLVVFLKRGVIHKHSLCIIEEPEAHLSFKNQKIMAQIIAMLIKKGIKVLITTHSDFLIYELNNLIMKHSIIQAKDKILAEKVKLEDETLKELENIQNDKIILDYSKVSLYNFEFKNNMRSTVKRVKIDKYGILNKYIFDNTYSMTKEKNQLLEIMELI